MARFPELTGIFLIVVKIFVLQQAVLIADEAIAFTFAGLNSTCSFTSLAIVNKRSPNHLPAPFVLPETSPI